MSAPVKSLPSRAEVPVEMTWDLSPLYATEQAWEDDFAKLASYPAKFSAFKGKLRRSGKNILAFIKLSEELGLMFGRLSLYASLRADEDTSNDHYKGLKERIRDASTEISKARSFYSPELLSIKQERLDKFVSSTPGLELYKHDFEDMTRLRAHVRTEEVEEVISTLSRALGGAQTIYSMFTNADWKNPFVTDESGSRVEMSNGVYSNMLESPNREVRKAAFEAMFDNFADKRNTFAATYSAQVTANIARSRVRKYPSVIEMSLAATNLPVSTYNNLINTVHANLPLLHRYLELRKRILKVDELHMYDLYVPIAEGVDHSITYKDAQETVLAALAPLGEEYVSALRDGYNSRWIDVVESRNKRTGAYHNSVYGSNPYMLMNWQDKIEQMFTLAHESGHAMHSYLSKKTQPYTYSGYTIFLAEMASTTNEALLAHYLLSRTTDKKMRMYILNKQMEGIRTTLVRQTLFAEFERDAHALAEKGEPLTPKVLCALHKGLNDKYYGAVVNVDQRIEVEWSRIPHFYNAFYVYTYATGISVATAMARMILTEGAPALKRYLKFLSSGSSDYSINILKETGIDLTTPAPIQAAFDSFAEYLAEFEKLAAEA